MNTHALYNEIHQNRSKEPTAYEGLLGDALERAFAMGIHDLDGLVAQINATGPVGMNGAPWTSATLAAELARLAA